MQEVILPGTFTIALSPSAMTLGTAQGGTVQIALTSVAGFSGPLSLTVGAIPTYAGATINPQTVTLAAGGTASANLVLITSTARLDPASFPGSSHRTAVLAALIAFLVPFRSRLPSRLRGILSMLLLAALVVGASGCGLLRIPFNTAAAGIYQVPVTATDTNHNSQTTMLRLTVTP